MYLCLVMSLFQQVNVKTISLLLVCIYFFIFLETFLQKWQNHNTKKNKNKNHTSDQSQKENCGLKKIKHWNLKLKYKIKLSLSRWNQSWELIRQIQSVSLLCCSFELISGHIVLHLHSSGFTKLIQIYFYNTTNKHYI